MKRFLHNIVKKLGVGLSFFLGTILVFIAIFLYYGNISDSTAGNVILLAVGGYILYLASKALPYWKWILGSFAIIIFVWLLITGIGAMTWENWIIVLLVMILLK